MEKVYEIFAGSALQGAFDIKVNPEQGNLELKIAGVNKSTGDFMLDFGANAVGAGLSGSGIKFFGKDALKQFSPSLISNKRIMKNIEAAEPYVNYLINPMIDGASQGSILRVHPFKDDQNAITIPLPIIPVVTVTAKRNK